MVFTVVYSACTSGMKGIACRTYMGGPTYRDTQSLPTPVFNSKLRSYSRLEAVDIFLKSQSPLRKVFARTEHTYSCGTAPDLTGLGGLKENGRRSNE
jgi:hypothetical protein